jgi:hypothetical protein
VAVAGGQILKSVAIPVDLDDRDTLIKSATTSLSSKVISMHSSLLAPMAVDCVLAVSEDCRKCASPLTPRPPPVSPLPSWQPPCKYCAATGQGRTPAPRMGQRLFHNSAVNKSERTTPSSPRALHPLHARRVVQPPLSPFASP